MTRGGPEALADVPLFAGLTKRHLRHIAGLTEEESFPEGSTLAEEGTPGETFHIMLEGEAKVVRDTRSVQTTLKTDGQGRVHLGPLAEIMTVTATGPEGTAHTWPLPTDRHTYRQLVHARAGDIPHREWKLPEGGNREQSAIGHAGADDHLLYE